MVLHITTSFALVFTGADKYERARVLPFSVAANNDPPVFRMQPYVGAEYTPWRAGNQLWWANYSQYAGDVEREVKAMRDVLGLTALRVFLHDMVFRQDPARLLRNMDAFLSTLHAHGMMAGFVFFDDCWQHSGANLSQTCTATQGIHNGCWYAAPQDVDRNGTARHADYVSQVVAAFKTDARVAWWEIFNEPRVGSSYSMGLRDAGYRWAMAQSPTQLLG